MMSQIVFCKECGAAMDELDRFCKKCGTPADRHSRPKNQRRHSEPRQERPPRRPPFTPALQTEEGQAEYVAIIVEKQAAAKRWRKGCWYITAVLALAVGIMALMGMLETSRAPYFAGGTGVVTLLMALFWGPGGMSPAEYYRIPGSRDEAGDHRCIHCGHRGIYRQGAYKSNQVSVQCSKCNSHFWTETK